MYGSSEEKFFSKWQSNRVTCYKHSIKLTWLYHLFQIIFEIIIMAMIKRSRAEMLDIRLPYIKSLHSNRVYFEYKILMKTPKSGRRMENWNWNWNYSLKLNYAAVAAVSAAEEKKLTKFKRLNQMKTTAKPTSSTWFIRLATLLILKWD